jgi:hypothetical protein
MKRGYLGLYQYFYLAGGSAGLRVALRDRGIGATDTSIPLEKMIYVAAFQGGIEKFVTPFKNASSHPLDRFISARTEVLKPPDAQLYKKILDLEPPPKTPTERNALVPLCFIYDLMVAMENRAALMYVSGIPKVEDVQRDLPPDVALPICTILSALKSADELLPAPSLIVNQNVVANFKYLLKSDVYHHYTDAHESIECEASKSALSNIRRRGAELLRVGEGVLASRRVSMSIISVVPKIVDTAFGKLPGALAQLAGDLATKFMEDKKNVVIYQFDDWANEYMRSKVSHLLGRS